VAQSPKTGTEIAQSGHGDETEGICQRRLNIDALLHEIAEAKLTEPASPDRGEREGTLTLAAMLQAVVLIELCKIL